jgi:S1-C subfamily serine protease
LIVGLTKSLDSTPQSGYFANVLVTDSSLDLAVLRLIDASGLPAKISGHDPVRIDYSQPPLGTRLATLGYPALGSYTAGMTITFTSGTFSGIDYSDGEFFKTDAQMRGGVSGGAAFNEKGLFIGVPTAGLIDEDSSNPVGINLIRPVKFAKSLLEEAIKLSGS